MHLIIYLIKIPIPGLFDWFIHLEECRAAVFFRNIHLTHKITLIPGQHGELYGIASIAFW